MHPLILLNDSVSLQEKIKTNLSVILLQLKLEELSTSFEGVSQAYAIQAGREVRVMVMPEKVDDLQAFKIARELKEKIENELTYPGQIKVTVIRETRAEEVAK